MGLPATSSSGPGGVFERVRGMADALSGSSAACHAAMTASTRGCALRARGGKTRVRVFDVESRLRKGHSTCLFPAAAAGGRPRAFRGDIFTASGKKHAV